MDYKYTVLTNTTIGAFMSQLDSNIVLIALPTITRDLKATPFEALWVIMGYILMTAVLLLMIGRLADVYGKVRLYNAGFAVFTIGSGLCSLSLNGTMLVLFRLVQGVGAALIWANNAAILTDAFPPSERGRAIGINLVAGIGGSVIGLVLGGILSASLGWQSIFWINLPIGAFATYWAYKKLRELGTTRREKLDPLGNLLFAGGLSLFLIGITLGSLSGWTITEIGMSITGLVLLGSFLLAESHARTPMMDLSLFKIRPFSAGIFSNFLSAIARGGTFLVLTFYYQGALQYDAFTTGILLIPFAVAFVTIGPLSGYLSDKYGARGFSTLGLLISAASYFVFSVLPGDVSYSIIVIPMVLGGVGGGLFVAPNISSIMNAMPVTRRGIASGMSATLVTTGALLSLAMSFTVMATNIPLDILQKVFAGAPVGSVSSANPHPYLDLFVPPMHTIFLIMGILSLVAAVPSAVRGSGHVDVTIPQPVQVARPISND